MRDEEVNIAGRDVRYKYFAILNIILIGLGVYICLDCVGALEDVLIERLDLSFSQYSLLYSINTWPNIVLSLFAGFMINRIFGLKWSTLVYCAVFAVGHLIYSFGIFTNTYWYALVGRAISGFGTECLYVCTQIFISKYLKSRELALFLSIYASISRLGGAIAYAVVIPIMQWAEASHSLQDVDTALLLMSLLSIPSIIGAFGLFFTSPAIEEPTAEEGLQQTALSVWDLFKFPVEFWLVIALHISFVTSIHVFIPFTQNMFKTVHNKEWTSANLVTIYFSGICAIMGPICSIIISKLGRAIIFSKVGLICALIAHLMLGFTTWSPFISTLILAVSYSVCNASIVPMFAFIIPKYKLVTAYKLDLAVINASYALFIYIAGATIDSYDYKGFEIYMIVVIVALGLLASTCLCIKDRAGSGILNMTPQQRIQLLIKLVESSETREPLNN